MLVSRCLRSRLGTGTLKSPLCKMLFPVEVWRCSGFNPMIRLGWRKIAVALKTPQRALWPVLANQSRRATLIESIRSLGNNLPPDGVSKNMGLRRLLFVFLILSGISLGTKERPHLPCEYSGAVFEEVFQYGVCDALRRHEGSCNATS